MAQSWFAPNSQSHPAVNVMRQAGPQGGPSRFHAHPGVVNGPVSVHNAQQRVGVGLNPPAPSPHSHNYPRGSPPPMRNGPGPAHGHGHGPYAMSGRPGTVAGPVTGPVAGQHQHQHLRHPQHGPRGPPPRMPGGPGHYPQPLGLSQNNRMIPQQPSGPGRCQSNVNGHVNRGVNGHMNGHASGHVNGPGPLANGQGSGHIPHPPRHPPPTHNHSHNHNLSPPPPMQRRILGPPNVNGMRQMSHNPQTQSALGINPDHRHGGHQHQRPVPLAPGGPPRLIHPVHQVGTVPGHHNHNHSHAHNHQPFMRIQDNHHQRRPSSASYGENTDMNMNTRMTSMSPGTHGSRSPSPPPVPPSSERQREIERRREIDRNASRASPSTSSMQTHDSNYENYNHENNMMEETSKDKDCGPLRESRRQNINYFGNGNVERGIKPDVNMSQNIKPEMTNVSSISVSHRYQTTTAKSNIESQPPASQQKKKKTQPNQDITMDAASILLELRTSGSPTTVENEDDNHTVDHGNESEDENDNDTENDHDDNYTVNDHDTENYEDDHDRDIVENTSDNTLEEEIVNETINEVEESLCTPCIPKNFPTRLALPNDEAKLNSLHCFLRSELLEIFVVERSQNKSPTHSPGSSVGRVGLRCVFCAIARKRLIATHSLSAISGNEHNIQHRDEAPMAVFYPKSIAEIYRLVTSWQRCHLRKCRNLPPDIRSKWTLLRENDKSRGKTHYWITSAKEIGLIDCKSRAGGIRFLNTASNSNAVVSVPSSAPSVPSSSEPSPTTNDNTTNLSSKSSTLSSSLLCTNENEKHGDEDDHGNEEELEHEQHDSSASTAADASASLITTSNSYMSTSSSFCTKENENENEHHETLDHEDDQQQRHESSTPSTVCQPHPQQHPHHLVCGV